MPALDDVPDQPSSPIPTTGQPSQDDRQEVLEDGSVSTRQRANHRDHERSSMEENIGVHTSLDEEELDNLSDEITPTLQSAPIDCNVENYNEQSQPSPGERQRPIRNASRPTRYRDAAFDTQFQPRPRRHRKIRRREATGNYVTTKEEYFRLGRGVKKKHPRSPPNPVKTSTTYQKRLSPAILQFSSTLLPQATSAHSSSEINKNVINARLPHDRTTMPTTAAAAVGGRSAATLPTQKVKVNSSNHGKTDTTAVSMPGKIQIASSSYPTISTQQNASLQSDIHPRRFRRKKRQKYRQQTQQE